MAVLFVVVDVVSVVFDRNFVVFEMVKVAVVVFTIVVVVVVVTFDVVVVVVDFVLKCVVVVVEEKSVITPRVEVVESALVAVVIGKVGLVFIRVIFGRQTNSLLFSQKRCSSSIESGSHWQSYIISSIAKTTVLIII